MVEMVETAAILNQATARSLVILDEIGRGTATFDGLSIAWATLEHLHEVNRCRALFATHYHELGALKERLAALAPYTMRVKEWQNEVVFLHEVAPGAADRSYGIHVAQLAGLPAAVVARAEEVLAALEKGEQSGAVSAARRRPAAVRRRPAAPGGRRCPRGRVGSREGAGRGQSRRAVAEAGAGAALRAAPPQGWKLISEASRAAGHVAQCVRSRTQDVRLHHRHRPAIGRRLGEHAARELALVLRLQAHQVHDGLAKIGVADGGERTRSVDARHQPFEAVFLAVLGDVWFFSFTMPARRPSATYRMTLVLRDCCCASAGNARNKKAIPSSTFRIRALQF